jgi:cell division protein FtsN
MSAASEAGRSNQILRVAIAVSLLVHLVLGLLFVLTEHELDRLLHVDRPHARPTPPSDEIVTISSALHIEKRAKPVPVRASARSAARRPPAEQQARTASAAQQVAVAPRSVAAPFSERAPSRLPHELASETNASTSQPAITRKARTVSQTPTAPPQTPAPEKAVARVEHPAAAARPAAASRSSRLSDAQLAKIEHDLAKTIAQSRAQADPLRVKPEAPAAPKSYRLQMHGVFGNLHRGQGQYYPVRGWHAGGVDWYYVSYEFTYADGTYETGNVPWPIHFTPGSDPFVNGLTNVQLPGPPPGFVPSGTLGKALRAYFPNLVFSNSDN